MIVLELETVSELMFNEVKMGRYWSDPVIIETELAQSVRVRNINIYFVWC